jgi:hypothetical protein
VKTKIRPFLIAVVLFAPTANAQAPTWSDPQAEVWTVVQQSWEDETAKDVKWPAEYTHEKFMAWGDSSLAPRDRDTFVKWVRTNEETADTFWYEITPLAIIIEGETAVVMYSSLVGEQSKNGDRSFVPYSIVEVLTQDGEDWQFLSTTSFGPDLAVDPKPRQDE